MTEDTNSSERNEKNVEKDSLTLDNECSEQGLLHSDTLALEVSQTSTLESPPIQVMERPAESSGYRIPSHVFARNKSNNPNQEWSIASNDSLFSIHTGNMSFTKDQFSCMLKSGELGYNGELGKVSDLYKSGELPPPSPTIVQKSREQKPLNICKSGEQIIATHFKPSSSKVPDVGVTTPCASDVASDSVAGIMKDEPKPDVKDNKRTKLSMEDVPYSASVSHHSDASGQSFAFPVLEEVEREKSVNSGNSKVRQQKKDSSPNEEELSKMPTSPPQGNSGSSLFSCFSCCSH